MLEVKLNKEIAASLKVESLVTSGGEAKFALMGKLKQESVKRLRAMTS